MIASTAKAVAQSIDLEPQDGTRQLGTHTDKFLLELGDTMKKVDSTESLIKALNSMKKRVLNEEFIFKLK